MVTPGSTAPDVSFTIPIRDPACSCADARAGIDTSSASRQMSPALRFISPPPMNRARDKRAKVVTGSDRLGWILGRLQHVVNQEFQVTKPFRAGSDDHTISGA